MGHAFAFLFVSTLEGLTHIMLECTYLNRRRTMLARISLS
jgi:hypothetical protein